MVLKDMVLPFATELRDASKMPSSAFVMYMDDEAPQHTGDKCHITKKVGYQDKRKNLLWASRIVRHLYSRTVVQYRYIFQGSLRA